MTAPIACAALALTACTAEEPEQTQTPLEIGLEATEEDEARLIAALAEADEVGYEITGIINRLERRCMEDKGFSVHDETIWYQPEYVPEEEEDQLEFDAPTDHIPTAEEAAENGFMVWTQTFDGSELAPPDPMDEQMEPYWELLDGPFYELPTEERKAWERAYEGVQTVKWRDDETSDDASRPEPGGCYGEVHRAVYGEPYQWSAPDETEGYFSWAWGEENPLYAGWNPTDHMRAWRDLTRDEEHAFLTCLDEGGNPGWDFNDDGYIDTFFYLHALYPQDPANAGIEFDPLPDWQLALMPEVPSDAPYDYDTAFATELALAEDFAACADGTGYREAGETRWRALHIGRMLEHETEVYAWQEKMNGYLATAQDLLEG
ncbi:hypothetical protein [Glycomyces sp. YM15]|uniref:hypothetical protein n=1 Tax=Glycomyces sp. YM15 TaxID=2800446 RepID=UPI0019637E77|nr:hypothetical protein [Glycomyces sp. YM15]